MRRRSGSTLLELLVALSLFTVGMVSVVQIFPANRRLLTQTSNATQAVFLAQEQLELMREVAYQDMTPGTFLAREAVTTDPQSPLRLYERRVQIQLLDGNRQTSAVDVGLKRVMVTIYWDERGQERTLTLSTYASR